MSTYNVMATLYLLSVGVTGAWVGRLLWPAVVLHAVLTAWCFAIIVCAPFQINCNPAKIATAATTAFNLRAGTTRATAHPSSTPGTPPASNCASTVIFIAPNFQ